MPFTPSEVERPAFPMTSPRSSHGIVWLSSLLALFAVGHAAALGDVNCSVAGTVSVNITTHTVNGHAGCVGSVAIPEGVTAIGALAFGNVPGLTSVTIPSSVTSIGLYAFMSATGLTEVTFAPGSQLPSIGIGAFQGASGLTRITIPDSVTTIGGFAFHSATSLTSITIPGSVTTIGPAAFRGASSLTRIVFGGNAPAVGMDAFPNPPTLGYRLSSAAGFGDGSSWQGLTLAYWMPAPRTPSAVAGVGSATATVTVPAVGPAPTSSTITAVEDPTRSCTVTGASGSCTVAGLTAGSTYTFTATATDGHATSAASGASNAVTPTTAPVAVADPGALPPPPPSLVKGRTVTLRYLVRLLGVPGVTGVTLRARVTTPTVCTIAQDRIRPRARGLCKGTLMITPRKGKVRKRPFAIAVR